MAYTPKTWQCGETIMADDLNHMEQGIEDASSGGGSEPLIFTVTVEAVPCPNNPSATAYRSTYSHSWQEIHDALSVGRLVVCPSALPGASSVELKLVTSAVESDGEYEVRGIVAGTTEIFPESFRFNDANSLVYTDEGDCGK